jgi:type I restriction enzyme, S subunit
VKLSMTPFADVVTLSRSRIADPLAAGIERFVGLEHIEPENLHISRWGAVADGTTFTNHFKPGQVLFGKRRAYQRKVAVADFEGVCSGDIYVFESKDPEMLLPELLPFICQSEGFYEYAVRTSAGSLSPRTNWKQLAKYEFPLPPIDEQRRIADLLWAADDVCEKHIALAKNINQLISSYQKDIFSNQQLYENNKSQKRKIKIGDVAKFQGGFSFKSKDYVGQGIPLLKIANVTADGMVWDDNTFLDKQFLDKYKDFALEANDIIMAMTRPITGGRLKIARISSENIPCLLNQRVGRFIITDSAINSDFLFFYLKSYIFRDEIELLAMGSQQPNVSSVQVEKIEFSLPDEKTQKIISEKYTELRNAKSEILKRLEECKTFRNSILNSNLEG